jgi:predicted transposase YdaD
LGLNLQESRVYQKAKAEGEQIGEQRGRQDEERAMVLRQLTRRMGVLPEGVVGQIERLSLEQLEDLGEALLDFTGMADLLD